MASESIFVGYRRDDTADVAGRIYDAMAARFGKTRVFKDVDNIGPGVDFGDYIKTVLPRCRVALVLIGPHWLDSKDEAGKRRLDDVHDWVRIEIETALATTGVLVVPVLVNGARMPRGEEVPESLQRLLRRNAAIIRRDPDFHDDVERLASAIRSSVNTGSLDLSKIGGDRKTRASAPAKRPREGNRAQLLIGGGIAATLALVMIGFGAWRLLPAQHPETAEERTSTKETARRDATELGRQSQEPAQPPSAASPTDDAETPTAVREKWRSANLRGHYHEEAVDGPVKIDREGSVNQLYINSPQARFRCTLLFGSDGRPQLASECKVRKYAGDGTEQSDVYWWTDDPIRLSCSVEGRREVCLGSYTLHFGFQSTGKVDQFPPERRTMRIIRTLS
ncbi:MAG: toll/interleukin-1 receptor domain-containing protein [Caulobacterales bacterium]